MTAPVITLVRHGQTPWNVDGKHTSVTDVPLSEEGERQARALRRMLGAVDFDLVVSSPMQRARTTARLAGFDGSVEVWDELSEWDYGSYEGISSPKIWEEVPGWDIFHFGAPGGESPEAVGARADRVLDKLRGTGATRIAVFSHGHFLRVMGARWIDLPPAEGIRLFLDTASVSELGWERQTPALTCWNDTSHVR